MAEEPDSRSTILESVSPFLDDDTEDEFREIVDSMTDGDHAKLDEAFATGIDLAETMQSPESTAADDTPPHHIREVVNEDGTLVGLRVIVDAPSVDPFYRDDTLLLRTAEGDVQIPVPFDAWDVEDPETPTDDPQAEVFVSRELPEPEPDDENESPPEEDPSDGDEED